MKLDVMKTINKYKKNINPRYDIRIDDIEVIIKNSTDKWGIFMKLFIYGYIQGIKAQRSGVPYTREVKERC